MAFIDVFIKYDCCVSFCLFPVFYLEPDTEHPNVFVLFTVYSFPLCMVICEIYSVLFAIVFVSHSC